MSNINTPLKWDVKWSQMRCIIWRPDLYSLNTKKKLKTYIIVKIEPSMNKSTKKPKTEVMLNLLEMSEICCTNQRHSTHTIYYTWN